jgi:FlaA1/EpsC-like NDP-sugar epimerase
MSRKVARTGDTSEEITLGQQTREIGARRSDALRVLAKHRGWIQTLIDVSAWVLGLWAAVLLRFEFDLAAWRAPSVFTAIALAAFLQLGAGFAGGLYIGRWRFGSFEEVAAVARASLVVTAALFAISRWAYEPRLVPVSVSIAGGIFAAVVMGLSRYTWRFFIDRGLRPSKDEAAKVLVFGAGEGGIQLVTAMLRNPESPFYPVALIDDDAAKQQLRVMGVPVVGGRDRLSDAVAEFGVSHLVIAIPSADGALVRELSNLALEADLDVSVLPRVDGLISTNVSLSDIRPVDERDLLGRHAITTNLEQIADFLHDRRVLVTGAGGSIGSELCRQLTRFGPSELVMLDRDESALHAVQMSIEGRAMLDSRNLVVADIRDADRIDEVFREHRPQVVFHAAALKHLPLLEMYPEEGVKTNVWGTQNLLRSAEAVGVARFVNVSTDKAADPTSVLGYTKRVAERLTAAVAAEASGTYLSVRFGNVLGSRGSVLEAFRKQIEAGGPLTVTHPDVTRYFMLVEEAVQLVIQAGAIGRDGEALVLDMGEPVKIDDVARRLAAQASRQIDVVYTGLRPGEKMHEVLLGGDEVDHRPAHPLISHVTVPGWVLGDADADGLTPEDIRTIAMDDSFGDFDAVDITRLHAG